MSRKIVGWFLLVAWGGWGVYWTVSVLYSNNIQSFLVELAPVLVACAISAMLFAARPHSNPTTILLCVALIFTLLHQLNGEIARPIHAGTESPLVSLYASRVRHFFLLFERGAYSLALEIILQYVMMPVSVVCALVFSVVQCLKKPIEFN